MIHLLFVVCIDIFRKPRGGNAQVNDSCQDVPTASESSSWNEDDKPCSSDDKISSLVRTGDVQRRC